MLLNTTACKERFVNNAIQPLRYRNDMQLLTQRGKYLSFKLVICTRIISFCTRIVVQQRTVVTLRLPLLTICTNKVGTMTCHRPTIVQGPHHRNIRLTKIFEQHLIVDIVTVEIVQMDNIWFNLLHLTDKTTCRPPRKEAVLVGILRKVIV